MCRIVPLVLALAMAATTPALARKWSSRSGSFRVEAELLDVRDGNAVLKKDDGSEVVVPLGKLSLADIRYIDGVLKSAEAGLGIKHANDAVPTVAPAAASPPAASGKAERPSASAAMSGAASRSFRYDWRPGQAFTYRVKMEVQLATGPEQVLRTIRYTVKSVSPDGSAEITFFETVVRSSNGKVVSASPYPVPSHFSPIYTRSRYSLGRYSTTSTPAEVVKIDRYGRILGMEGGAHFPFFLGRAAHLPFEPLSALAENPWTVATDIAFKMSTIDWLPNSMLAKFRREELPGREKSFFSIAGADSKQLSVRKTYEASSAAQVEGRPQVALSGESELTFERRRGLFSSAKMKVRVAMHDGAVLLEVPLQVSFELGSEAEEAQLKADAEKAKKESEDRVKDANRPLTVADLQQIVKDLNSGDLQKVSAAEIRLAVKKPEATDRKVIAALEALLKHENAPVRAAAARFLAHCATTDNVPALVKMLDSDSALIRADALIALGRLKATTAIDRIAQQVSLDPFQAGHALREMGPAAEPAALKLLTHGDRKAREQACQVLSQIGTKKSLPALEKAQKGGDRMMQIFAEQAIKSIQHRQ